MLRVAAVDAEGERRAPFAALSPGLDDIAGHDGAVHRISELSFVKIAGDGLDPGEVGLARRKDFEAREKAIANQIGGGPRDDQVIVVFAETAGPWRADKPTNGMLGQSLIHRKISRWS